MIYLQVILVYNLVFCCFFLVIKYPFQLNLKRKKKTILCDFRHLILGNSLNYIISSKKKAAKLCHNVCVTALIKFSKMSIGGTLLMTGTLLLTLFKTFDIRDDIHVLKMFQHSSCCRCWVNDVAYTLHIMLVDQIIPNIIVQTNNSWSTTIVHRRVR